MPFTAGALLPKRERVTSLAFRRFAYYFKADRVDTGSVMELCAFLHVVPVRWAKLLFEWNAWTLKTQVPEILRLPCSEYVDANLKAMDVEDGLAVLRGMMEGGWKGGSVPWIVKMALQGLRDRGETIAEIADRTGLTWDQVQYICTGRPVRANDASRAAIGLAIG